MTRELTTYCRICDPQCGLIATVEDGRLVKVRGDRDHVHSKGFVCTKAQAMVEVTYDADRLLQPMKRVGGPGEFEPVGWDEALGDIADRLTAIRHRHGAAAFATFLGNPPVIDYATAIWFAGFRAALGVRWAYAIGSEDTASRMAANALLYGSVALMPVPDLWRTHFVLILGANPVVSKGSLVSVPQFREALDSVVQRGGRVVVVDPRRSETASHFEHVPVLAGTDTYLLLGILHTLVSEDLVDHEFLAAHTTGYDRLVELVEPFDADTAAAACRVPSAHIRELARAFAAAPSGVVYGRTGTCTQRFGTLNNLLQDLVMILTGNVENEGGLLFGWGPIDFAKFAEKGGFATYASDRSRVTNMPDVASMFPSTSLVPDITTPGAGQVRALMTLGCNPVLSSAGGGAELEAALEELELHFSLDLYVNETN
ncbi:MAG: hypothetical protein QOI47_2117, partial [Actinomycetota bacterium]|nr:hypothetical protein [Actinomycetota bacterium]